MASQGPLSGSTFVDDSSIGTVAWSTPANAASSNDVRTQSSIGSGSVSHYLKCTGFGFTIPEGSVINGIVVGIERSESAIGGGNVVDNSVKIVQGGAILGSEKKTFTSWTTTDTYENHGTGLTDLFGLTWTATQINDSGFGVAISAKETTGTDPKTARIDHVRITVYYTPSIPISASSESNRDRRSSSLRVFSITK
jgi:hypothetical protein